MSGTEEVLTIVRDVTERKALERRLEHQAFHDALTGLPNLLSSRIASSTPWFAPGATRNRPRFCSWISITSKSPTTASDMRREISCSPPWPNGCKRA